MTGRQLASSAIALSEEAPRASLDTKRLARLGAIVVAAIFLGFGTWAATARLASGIIAFGKVTVDSQRKPVQTTETGVVRTIHVRDGDSVEAGAILVTLDRTRPGAELAIVASAYDQALAEEARLTAELSGAEFMNIPEGFKGRADETAEILAGQEDLFRKRRDARAGERDILLQRDAQLNGLTQGLHSQIAAKRKQISIISQELEGLETLLAEGLTTRQRVFALRRDKSKLDGEIGQHESDLARAATARGETELEIRQLDTKQLEESSSELSQVRTRLVNFGERLTAVQLAYEQTEIRAPAGGVIVDLKIHSEGAVVAGGETLLEIVPARDRLIVEAKIRPQDVDVVTSGQDADIRFTAFNFRTTPVLKGRVNYVSADSLVDPATGLTYFLVRVSILDGELERLPAQSITPGMPAEVIVKSGEQTALAYLLRPLTNSFARAWREQ